MSDVFSIKKGLKQGDALLPLLFKSVLEYAIWTVRVKQDGLKLNGTYQLLVCADDIYEGWNFNSGNYLFTTDTK